MHRRIFLIFIPLAFLPCLLIGQTPRQGEVPEQLERLRYRLEAQSRVQVFTGFQWRAAYHPRLVREGLSFATSADGSRRDTALYQDVAALRFRASAVKKGVKIGAIAGTSVGALLGAVAGSLAGGFDGTLSIRMLTPPPNGGAQLEKAVLGALVGAGFGCISGGLLGALIAAPFKEWRTVYISDAPPRVRLDIVPGHNHTVSLRVRWAF